jgi:hypothetical protein
MDVRYTSAKSVNSGLIGTIPTMGAESDNNKLLR